MQIKNTIKNTVREQKERERCFHSISASKDIDILLIKNMPNKIFHTVEFQFLD